ncbi:hypothetical protein [Stenotrophomonas sp. NA06056]|uniref:hypothetical protein n=1 Tax=Stenotrophomonas sp. NA06056 TaxID=2742129 RepID=UPI0015892D09|nr:hypothetical protein [Stenotrophomonas sp. NA06056]QKW58103.1 hypothetical protein HUT07_16420 [Stenotrophomonas sp. NA06056]
MLKPAFILLLGTPLTAVAAQPVALSLEDTFDAYVQVILHGNEASKETLRENLLLLENSDSVDAIVDALDALQLSKAAFNGTAMEPVSRALEMRRKTLSCTITNITRETVHSTPQAKVAYRCAFPDLSGFFATYRNAQKRRAVVGDVPEDAKALFVAFANALRDAPDRSHEGSAVFLKMPDNGPWLSSNLPQLGMTLLQQALPFDTWNTRVEAESVPTVTGIPTCDLMMAAELTFIARHHPQNPFLSNGMLQGNLLKRVEGMSDEEATRDCRMVHERNRELWNREKTD